MKFKKVIQCGKCSYSHKFNWTLPRYVVGDTITLSLECPNCKNDILETFSIRE